MTERQKAQFYASSAWHRARQRALQRDRYLCQDCLSRAMALRRAGIRKSMDIPAATVVHHIVPYEQAPEKALLAENLVSLCGACHNARHPEKLDGRRPSQRQADKHAPLTEGVKIVKI